MAQGWNYFLARSRDRSIIAPLVFAEDRTISFDLNKSGQAGFSQRMNRLGSGDIWPWRTCLLAQFDNNVLWSGPINSRQSDLASGKVTATAVGWFERLMFLEMPERKIYQATDAGQIVSELLQYAKIQDSNLPISMGRVEVTQTRTITYEEGQSIGQAILDLANLESGFDWEIDPVLLQLSILARRCRDQKRCKWIFMADDVSKMSNLQNVVENVGGDLSNSISPIGKYGRLKPPQVDGVSQVEYGVFQRSPALSDVTSVDLLTAYAAAEIFYTSQPRVTYTLTPLPNLKANVPVFGRDFDLGDKTYMTAVRDYVEVYDQPVRTFGVTLNIANNGVTQITNLQITAV